MNRKPSIDEQRAFYDQWNVAHRSGEFEQIAPEIRDRGAHAVELLRKMRLPTPTILEVGCGTGWLTGKLCELGTVTAIDLSPQAIVVANRRGLPARFLDGDFLEVPFAEASFDVIVCVETLFYIEDQPTFVDKLARLLKPRGALLITMINKFVYERSSDVHPPQPGQIRNWLSREEVRRLLSGHFQVEQMATLGPRGDRGILRYVNAPKVDAALGGLLSAGGWRRMKEQLGLGGGVVVVARKQPSRGGA